MVPGPAATLVIRRSPAWPCHRYRVEVDGRPAGRLGRGETLNLAIAPGAREVRISRGWRTLGRAQVDLRAGERSEWVVEGQGFWVDLPQPAKVWPEPKVYRSPRFLVFAGTFLLTGSALMLSKAYLFADGRRPPPPGLVALTLFALAGLTLLMPAIYEPMFREHDFLKPADPGAIAVAVGPRPGGEWEPEGAHPQPR